MDQTTILLTRALAIAFSGGFAWSMINLVWSGRLNLYLSAQKFQTIVLVGGVLLTLAVLLKIRAIATGKGHSHDDHDHSHDHEHDHGPELAHAHAGAAPHSHDHGHEHEDAGLWRYFVLVFPLGFIFLNLAPTELSADAKINRLGKQARDALKQVQAGQLKGLDQLQGEPLPADWKNIEKGGNDFLVRDWYKDQFEKKKRAFKVWGQFMPDPNYPDKFRILVQKRTCCAADQTSLGLTVLAHWADRKWPAEQWLEIVGAVVYHEYKDPKTNEVNYFPVMYPIEMKTSRPQATIDG